MFLSLTSVVPRYSIHCTISGVHPHELFAFLVTSPVDRVATLLASAQHVGHGPSTFSCVVCRDRWEQMGEILSRRDKPAALLSSIASLWWDDHKIMDGCGSCAGCRAELDSAAQAAVLAAAGVNMRFLQGPMHSVVGHGQGKGRCQPCLRWNTARRTYAESLTRRGHDPIRWLPVLESSTDLR
jgi:hypothetical protein